MCTFCYLTKGREKTTTCVLQANGIVVAAIPYGNHSTVTWFEITFSWCGTIVIEYLVTQKTVNQVATI